MLGSQSPLAQENESLDVSMAPSTILNQSLNHSLTVPKLHRFVLAPTKRLVGLSVFVFCLVLLLLPFHHN